MINALKQLLNEVRREKDSLRSVLLEGIFWRLIIIEAVILIWSLAYFWFTEEEPTARQLFQYGLQQGILVTLVLAFIVISLGNFMAKKIIAPLEGIAKANLQLKDKEQTAMQIPIPRETPKEIRDIVASRTYMLRSIFKVSDERLKMVQFLRDTFGRYYSDKILDEILDPKDSLKLGGKRATLTMLMSDIRGFTTLSQSLPPEELVTILNRYLGEMTTIIHRHDGIIDEFIGDAILAFFGMNEHETDHAEQAAACAIAMQNALLKLTRELEAEGYPPIEMGIGINTGSVIVGNIGSPARMKFGIVGSAINETARIESNTTGGQILMGQASYRLIRPKARTEFKHTLQAKGMKEPIEIYSLVGLDGADEPVLKKRLGPPATIEFSVSFDYWVVRNKEIVGESKTGKAHWANSQAFRVELPEEIPPMTNLRLRFHSAFQGHEFEDIYTKTTFHPSRELSRFTLLRITAMTHKDHEFMSKALEAATVPA